MVFVDDCNVCREQTMCTKPGQAICAACTPHVCHVYLPGDDWCDWCASPIPSGNANPTSLPLIWLHREYGLQWGMWFGSFKTLSAARRYITMNFTGPKVPDRDSWAGSHIRQATDGSWQVRLGQAPLPLASERKEPETA